jgi:hypothetical protein
MTIFAIEVPNVLYQQLQILLMSSKNVSQLETVIWAHLDAWQQHQYLKNHADKTKHALMAIK